MPYLHNLEIAMDYQSFDVEVVAWDSTSGTLMAIQRLPGDATLKKFEMRAHSEALSIYIAVSSNPVPATWLCFAWRTQDSAKLRRGPVMVRTVVLTPQQRDDLGVTDTAGNLTTIVPRLLM